MFDRMPPEGDVTWMADAACRDKPVRLFFPSYGQGVATAFEAKQVCAGCAVKVECLGYAVEHGMHGVWGGMTEQERTRHTGKRIRR